MFQAFIKNLKHQFTLPLPGEDVQFEMAHVSRERIIPNSSEAALYRPSAVLVLVYPNTQNEATILLLERPTYDGHHSGQIGFPGGKAELHDANLQATALREFYEETGCVETPIIIGEFTPVYIPISKFMVQAYMAYLPKKPLFTPDTREVYQLLELTFSHLLAPLTIKETVVSPAPNLSFKTPYFDLDNKVVWGATAMILNELKVMTQRE